MTDQPSDSEYLAAHGLAARILLAYGDGDLDQVNARFAADPAAAVHALATFALTLVEKTYGDQVRDVLHSIATAADLDAIAREVTG